MSSKNDEVDEVDEVDEEDGVECAVCHVVETEGDLFDLDMYKCGSCGKSFHADCLGIEPDSQLDVDYMSWWNDETDVVMDRWDMPEKFCPLCREK